MPRVSRIAGCAGQARSVPWAARWRRIAARERILISQGALVASSVMRADSRRTRARRHATIAAMARTAPRARQLCCCARLGGTATRPASRRPPTAKLARQGPRVQQARMCRRRVRQARTQLHKAPRANAARPARSSGCQGRHSARIALQARAALRARQHRPRARLAPSHGRCEAAPVRLAILAASRMTQGRPIARSVRAAFTAI